MAAGRMRPAILPEDGLFIADDQHLRGFPEAGRIGDHKARNDLAVALEPVGVFGVCRDDRHALLSHGHLRQQPRIGLREAIEPPLLVGRQRAPDEALLVDDLRVAQLLLGPDNVVDRVELILQLGLLAAQGLHLGTALGHRLRQGLHLEAHLRQLAAQPLDLARLLGQLTVQVRDHLVEPLDPLVGLAQQRRRALQ